MLINGTRKKLYDAHGILIYYNPYPIPMAPDTKSKAQTNTS